MLFELFTRSAALFPPPLQPPEEHPRRIHPAALKLLEAELYRQFREDSGLPVTRPEPTQNGLKKCFGDITQFPSDLVPK
jgi:hypothetical protein